MKPKIRNPHIGSSFDDFLKEEGIYDEVREKTELDLIAIRLEEARRRQRITKPEMAKRMRTTLLTVKRLFDPSFAGKTLSLLRRAAKVLGFRIAFDLRPSGDFKQKLSAKKIRAIA
ncbi:MAG TPA: Fis family transcriptional regulator [Planctomycetota bacterium]|nr:Fis family transcriptional regulator [Planctomycetota bacterium]